MEQAWGRVGSLTVVGRTVGRAVGICTVPTVLESAILFEYLNAPRLV